MLQDNQIIKGNQLSHLDVAPNAGVRSICCHPLHSDSFIFRVEYKSAKERGLAVIGYEPKIIVVIFKCIGILIEDL